MYAVERIGPKLSVFAHIFVSRLSECHCVILDFRPKAVEKEELVPNGVLAITKQRDPGNFGVRRSFDVRHRQV